MALAIARRTRSLLLARGYRVAMTRNGAGYRGGNRERARFCNERDAALMIRIHADGSADPRRPRDLDARAGAAPRLDERHLRREPARRSVAPA